MATTLAPTSYRDEWSPPNQWPEVWTEFHRNYWGAASGGRASLDEIARHPPLNRFLNIWPAPVLEGLGLSGISGVDNSLFVREEMLFLARRCRDAYDLPEESIDGVVLLGQSGIGKTAFLIFFLVQCLSRGEPVLFTTRFEDTYLFNEHGVAVARASDFYVSTHLPPRRDGTRRVWSLVDYPIMPQSSRLSVTLHARPQVFFITALCPGPDKPSYEPFKNEPTVRTWWMSRWSDEELLALFRPSRGPALREFGVHDAATVRLLRASAGPVPGSILRLLLDPQSYFTWVREEMAFSRLRPVLALVLGTEAFSNEDYGYITFAGRAGPQLQTVTGLEDDTYEVGFKTRAIADAVMDRLASGWVLAEERRRLFARCMALPENVNDSHREATPTSSLAALPRTKRHPHPRFASFLFEMLARQYVYAPFDVEPPEDGEAVSPHAALSVLATDLGGSPGPPHHHQFAPMVPAPACSSSSRSGEALMVFKALRDEGHGSARRTTVVVDKRRGITWRANGSSLEPHPNSSSETTPPGANLPGPVPWGARRSVPITLADIDSEELPLDATRCYRPAYPHPVFDALFFQVIRCERRVILWAVQIASNRREDSEHEDEGEDMDEDEGGFAMVARLCERARDALPGAAVEVKYALVVPRDSTSHDAGLGSAFDVEWELGDGFWGNEGEVYVQFVDVCGVCRVEDVFRVPVPVSS